ncbi:MAG: hypothetical protein AAFU64_01645 [Bacteroidota bacterium]
MIILFVSTLLRRIFTPNREGKPEILSLDAEVMRDAGRELVERT